MFLITVDSVLDHADPVHTPKINNICNSNFASFIMTSVKLKLCEIYDKCRPLCWMPNHLHINFQEMLFHNILVAISKLLGYNIAHFVNLVTNMAVHSFISQLASIYSSYIRSNSVKIISHIKITVFLIKYFSYFYNEILGGK